MKLKDKITKRFGYELISRKKHPSLHSHIQNLIKLYEVDLVLDVGANNGQFGMMLREQGYTRKIVSFEPVTTTYDELRKTAEKDPNWHLFKMGMGAEKSNAVINVSRSSDFSSLLSPNEFGRSAFSNIEVDHCETIDIDTIDNFLAREDFRDFSRIFLKMDTQGFDCHVFRGAKNSLSRICCMLSEISLIPIYSGMPHYLESLKSYEEGAFNISGVYPVNRKKDLSVIELDCVMVNRKFAECIG